MREVFLEVICSLRFEGWVEISWMESRGKSRLGKGNVMCKSLEEEGKVCWV